ncbi:hypothetical protein [Maribellus mangrovi]|uniref:hypothetical protein n=1 Tax=Maribellus mangrovi TaxID=3133146 RepID=UPI0030EC2B62
MESNNFRNLVPSVGGSFSHGWSKIFGKAFLPLLLTVIIIGLLSGPAYSVKMDEHNWGPMLFLLPLALFGLAYLFLFYPVLEFGKDFIFVKAMRDDEVDLKTLFEGFKTKYLNIILANLIVSALVILGTMMLIIPGIIVACRLVFVSYLVMDKDMDAMKAVEKSWQMTRGHGWKVFGMAILSFFIFIGGLIVFFVGSIIALMWIHSAFASLYLAVLNENDDDNPIPILGVNEVD